jgi:hypothetical protein
MLEQAAHHELKSVKGHRRKIPVQKVPFLPRFDSVLTPWLAMSPTEDFFDSLLRQKGILDRSPFLDANSQRGLEPSYCHLYDILKYSRSKQTQARHEKARQHLRNINSIAKPLFVIVGTTNTITDLASLDHDEIFPRLENWWRDNPPSQKFESRTLELFRELDNKKERGGFTHLQGKSCSLLLPD